MGVGLLVKTTRQAPYDRPQSVLSERPRAIHSSVDPGLLLTLAKEPGESFQTPPGHHPFNPSQDPWEALTTVNVSNPLFTTWYGWGRRHS
jgi:hypothetical protein